VDDGVPWQVLGVIEPQNGRDKEKESRSRRSELRDKETVWKQQRQPRRVETIARSDFGQCGQMME
jgi:hypothetical protein